MDEIPRFRNNEMVAAGVALQPDNVKDETENKTKVKMKTVDVLKKINKITNDGRESKSNGIGNDVETARESIEEFENKDVETNGIQNEHSDSVKREEKRDVNESLSKLIQNRNAYAELDDNGTKVKCEGIKSANNKEEVNDTDVEQGTNENGCKDRKNEKSTGMKAKKKTSTEVGIDIRVTMAATDSSLEDEEVKTIMESCDELEEKRKERNRKARKFRKLRKYDEIKMGRKRSKSIDNGTLQSGHNFDFTKFGISVGSGIPNDLLPGIEDYLSNVLANETLSEYAEEQRQYFLERLDIIKLPPSIPPRPQSLGVRLYPVHSSPPASNRDSIRSLEQEDFAAYQRELSRALQGETPTTPDISEVKVYDDIDTTDGSLCEIKASEVEEEEESVYEIPQLRRTLSDSGYEKALELSPLSKSASSEEQLSGQSGPPMPPPLPPRGERTASDAASRSSIGSLLEERLSDSSFCRTKLNRESSVPARLEKSADARSLRSNEDLLDEEYDGASGDSLDEVGSLTQNLDPALRIKLPRPVKRKHRSQHQQLGKSMSSLWEITQPFGMLEDVVMSGELHYRSKLTWTRKIVALTNGRLVCYKVDKTDSRPAFVILLTGYEATFHKREGRRSFEIHLDHDNFESYVFLVDFKEWAVTWCEHINASAKGQRAAGPVVHLARSSMIANQDGTYHMAASNRHLSNSNASLASSDGLEGEPGTIKVKKMDQSGIKTAKMGSFAFKATQFFESLGKKSSIRKSASTSLERSPSVERVRQSSGSQSSVGETIEKTSPITPNSYVEESPLESPIEMKKHIKHQGYLDIYSSFNKRKWGKRWCLVHENNFECYRTQTSDVCELEFLLRNCVLRRAIQETKSELGLMLLENNREKITIEPVNWTELGSWLRILMQETSTPATPEGLEGYMDDTHPYHEAVEITRVPDPVKLGSAGSVKARGRSLTSPTEDNAKQGSHGNRDSGICSSESTDDRFNSLERNLDSPKVHPCFTDSSLPRVSVSDTGAIYTQVKKPSLAGSTLFPGTGSKNIEKKTEGSSTSNVETDDNKVKANTNSDDDTLFFDFDIGPFENRHNKRGSSLVDEIMSELKIQQSNNTQNASEEGNVSTETVASHMHSDDVKKRKSVEFSPDVNELSPIKSLDIQTAGNDSDFLCSSFVDIVDSSEKVSAEGTCNKVDVVKAKAGSQDGKCQVSVRRHPSNVSAKDVVDVTETLAELRTRLVQLKKDRISIRDRKQQISSERDREFLEAEYERLDRECKKVSDEINQLEQSTGIVSENNTSNEETQNMIAGITELKQSEKMVSENIEAMEANLDEIDRDEQSQQTAKKVSENMISDQENQKIGNENSPEIISETYDEKSGNTYEKKHKHLPISTDMVSKNNNNNEQNQSEMLVDMFLNDDNKTNVKFDDMGRRGNGEKVEVLQKMKSNKEDRAENNTDINNEGPETKKEINDTKEQVQLKKDNQNSFNIKADKFQQNDDLDDIQKSVKVRSNNEYVAENKCKYLASEIPCDSESVPKLDNTPNEIVKVNIANEVAKKPSDSNKDEMIKTNKD